jgi:hypothetical protein
MNVFLSYAANDKYRVEKVMRELKSRGVVSANDTVTENSEISAPGSSLRGAVRKAIEASSKVVVFWSAAGGKSDWVNYEIGMADALGKPILIVASKGEISSLPNTLQGNEIIELEDAR